MGSRRYKSWKISTIRYRCNAYGTEISRFGRIVIDKEFLSERGSLINYIGMKGT